jgi:hypothetical protein
MAAAVRVMPTTSHNCLVRSYRLGSPAVERQWGLPHFRFRFTILRNDGRGLAVAGTHKSECLGPRTWNRGIRGADEAGGGWGECSVRVCILQTLIPSVNQLDVLGGTYWGHTL